MDKSKVKHSPINVTFRGEEYPVIFNQNVFLYYAKERDLKYLNDVFKDLAFDGDQENLELEKIQNISLFFWCGLKEGARQNAQKLTLEVEDVNIIIYEDTSLIEKMMKQISINTDKSEVGEESENDVEKKTKA